MQTLTEDQRPVGVSAPAVTQSRARDHTADLVRVLLFTMVVVVHSVAAIDTGPDVIRMANLVGVLGHLTRYGFVAVTMYVLVLSTRNKNLQPVTFWRRRFGLVVWPYLLWTLIYTLTDHLVIADNPFTSPQQYLHDLALDIATGNGKYQLYFLLISMQIYLFFPLLAVVGRRIVRAPWRTLTGAAAVQFGMFVLYQYVPRPGGAVWTVVFDNLWKTLPVYALFLVIGGLAAVHHEALNRWLRHHATAVVAVAAVATSFSVGAYLLATSPGVVPLQSSTPWNPLYLPWFVAGLTLLWLAAMAANARRQAGKFAASGLVAFATMRAFGVFAVHPLILDVLLRVGYGRLLDDWFPNSAAIETTLLTVTVLLASLLLVDIIMRTPFSRWLVGRPRRPLPHLLPVRRAVTRLWHAASVPHRRRTDHLRPESPDPGGQTTVGGHHHDRRALDTGDDLDDGVVAGAGSLDHLDRI